MEQIYIFAGTTEGRSLSDVLSAHGIPCTVSVATEYGAQTMEEAGVPANVTLRTGRLNREQIAEALKAERFTCVVDATHPYAMEATKAIRGGCEDAGVKYLRLSRETAVNITLNCTTPLYVDTLDQALSYLASHPGNILAMTGSKEIGKIAEGIGDRSRLFARVLPSVESIQLCEAAGLTGKQILAMQGPFSDEMNRAMLHSTNAKYLLTKETGKAGGFFEKLTAAEAVGVQAVVVKNPERESAGLSFDEVLKELETLTHISLTDGNSPAASSASAG